MRGLLLGLLLISNGAAQAQIQGPIDPNWVYITAVKWVGAPKFVHERSASVRIAILYPEGEYVEVGTVLIERNKTVTFSAGDGLVIRGGRWSRTDEGVIRLHSRDVYRSVEIVGQHLPNPFMDETCGLEGKSKEHLANSIHCKRLSFAPLRLSLDLTELRNDAQISYRWQVGQ